MRAWPRKIIAMHTATGIVLAALVGVVLAIVAPLWCAALGPIVGIGYYAAATQRYRRRRRVLSAPFPEALRDTLLMSVRYYRQLPAPGRLRFENDVAIFLSEQRITPEKGTRLAPETPILIAAGAAMLGHHLPDWDWDSLRDILVYPDAFDEAYRVGRGPVLVGQVARQGPVILSQPRILRDFAANDSDNVVLHELAHVIDFADGHADGSPPGADAVSSMPWLGIIAHRLERVRARRSVLRDYAGTNEAELFAVAVEMFFGDSGRLKSRDPTLYRMLSLWFDQDPAGSNEASFPGRPEGARTLSGEEEPWAATLAYSDVSGDPAAIERVRALEASEHALCSLGFEPLGVARAVSMIRASWQRFSRVVRSADGVVVASITATPGGPRIELGSLLEDGSVVKTAPRLGFWEALPDRDGVRQHPDDGFELVRVGGSLERQLHRHRERIRELGRSRGVAAVAAESMDVHFAIELRAGELRDARRPAEARIARRAAWAAAALLALAIWVPFRVMAPAPRPEPSVAPVVGIEAPPPNRVSNRTLMLPQYGLTLGLVAAVGAYPYLRRAARHLLAPRLARFRPGPRRPDAQALMARVAKKVARVGAASEPASLVQARDND